MTCVRSFSFGFLLALLVVFCATVLLPAHPAYADTVSELQAQIAEHNKQIQAIQADIAAYQKQLDTLGSQKQTLQSTIKTIDVSRSQTAAQISATKKKINASNIKLRELALEIDAKQQEINVDQETLARSIREIAHTEENTMVEELFGAESLGDAWVAVDRQTALNGALREHAALLASAKIQLSTQHTSVSSTKTDLTSLNSNLTTQKQALDANRQAKDALLTQTKSKESEYQSLIAKKKAQAKVFEDQLSQLQSQLTSVNSSSIPKTGSGILAWPFASSLMQSCASRNSIFGNAFCVTQYFGNTAFAAAGAYKGAGHNGIDVGIPVGTPIQASLSGTIMGTGNTDLVSGCYSFGKWVAIKHANGLATVYAHLSSIKVSTGQTVSTGDVIGFSGMTGYATGPHLHYGVYAVGTPEAPGIQIMTLSSFKGTRTACANATMPVAPTNAYLNPISYL
ncbi:MAG: putative zinc metalloprotease [Parcubacteria bacterium C7867-001]|nr:MAG: putative zinc metalloprotease [Parcubacteria bacterium C7867-001]